MNQDHGDTIRRLEADIALIKEAIHTNNRSIRQYLAAPKLGVFFLGLGAACFSMPLIWHIILLRYGSFRAIPNLLSLALILFTVLVVVGISLWKLRIVSRHARKVDPRDNWSTIIARLSGHPVFTAQGFILLFTIYLAITAVMHEAIFLIPAIIAGGMAVVFILYLVVFFLHEYLFITIWLSLFLAVVIQLPVVPPLISAAIGFGVGFIVFGIMLHGSNRLGSSEKRDGKSN